MVGPETQDAAQNWWVQVGGALIVLGAFATMVMNALKGQKQGEAAKEPATHLVLDAMSPADTRPFRDLLNSLVAATDRNVATNEAIRTLTERDTEASEAILSVIREWIKEERELRRERERDERTEERMEQFMRSILHGQPRRGRPDEEQN